MTTRKQRERWGQIGGYTVRSRRDPQAYTAKARETVLDSFLQAQPADLPPEEREARAALGSLSAVQEPARNHGWDVTVATLVQDLRYAVSYLVKAPGFTLAATLSLGLGIGANSAIVSMVNATLLKRLPVDRSEELVAVSSPSGSGTYSYPAFDDMRRASATVMSGMMAFGGIGVSMAEGDAIDLAHGLYRMHRQRLGKLEEGRREQHRPKPTRARQHQRMDRRRS